MPSSRRKRSSKGGSRKPLAITFSMNSRVKANKDLSFDNGATIIKKGRLGTVTDHWELGGVLIDQVRFDGETTDRIVDDSDLDQA